MPREPVIARIISLKWDGEDIAEHMRTKVWAQFKDAIESYRSVMLDEQTMEGTELSWKVMNSDPRPKRKWLEITYEFEGITKQRKMQQAPHPHVGQMYFQQDIKAIRYGTKDKFYTTEYYKDKSEVWFALFNAYTLRDNKFLVDPQILGDPAPGEEKTLRVAIYLMETGTGHMAYTSFVDYAWQIVRAKDGEELSLQIARENRVPFERDENNRDYKKFLDRQRVRSYDNYDPWAKKIRDDSIAKTTPPEKMDECFACNKKISAENDCVFCKREAPRLRNYDLLFLDPVK